MNNPAQSNIKPMQNEQIKGTALSQQVSGRAKKRRSRGRKMFLYGFVAWAAYVFFFVQIPELNRLHQSQQTVSQEIQQANQKDQNLQMEIQQLNDPNYIAEIARKQYMMAKDGETLFVEPK